MRMSQVSRGTVRSDLKNSQGDAGADGDSAERASDKSTRGHDKKFKGRGKTYTSIKDVDEEIARLKPPPEVLTAEEFVEHYQLEMTRENPHDFRKGRVNEKIVQELFGQA